MLSKGETLPKIYKNHPLHGKLKGYYDCHVLNDLVLIYKIEKERLVLLLFDIETHSNLFWLRLLYPMGYTLRVVPLNKNKEAVEQK